jgi:hypothetical protein
MVCVDPAPLCRRAPQPAPSCLNVALGPHLCNVRHCMLQEVERALVQCKPAECHLVWTRISRRARAQLRVLSAPADNDAPR